MDRSNGSDPSAQVITQTDGPVATVRLHQPAKRNAVSLQMRAELHHALAHLHASVRSVVLTGSGSYFSAGGDLSETTTAEQESHRYEHLTAVVDWLIAGPVPVVAAVEGGAHGVGLSLVTASDYVVAADDAVFRAPFVHVGLSADGGLTWTLPRRVGGARARAMLLSGQPMSAQQAFDIGLVDALSPPGESVARAVEVARQWAVGSPTAMAAVKRALADAPTDHLTALAQEEITQRDLQHGADHAEGRAAFTERRAPRFADREVP